MPSILLVACVLSFCFKSIKMPKNISMYPFSINSNISAFNQLKYYKWMNFPIGYSKTCYLDNLKLF